VWRTKVRAALATVLSRLPPFRGLGRLVLALDRGLTDPSTSSSYMCVGKLNGSARFRFDLRPWGQKFAFYYGRWECEHVAMLRRLYAGGTFLDVGSSLGLYVVGLGPRVRALRGQILAIEPVAFNLSRQQENIRLNGLDSVVRHMQLALGASTGSLRLHVDPLGADNNAFASDEGAVAVPMVRLDDLMASMPDLPPLRLIKMDVEGFEPYILRGGQKTLAKFRPVIFAEFNRERMAINGVSMQESWELLRTLGYGCHVLRNRRLRSLSDPGSAEDLYFLPSQPPVSG